MDTPQIGDIAHYVSFGTPGGEYTSQCRAAIVTDVPPLLSIGEDGVTRMHNDGSTVGLCVLNPTGQFFNPGVQYHSGVETPGDPGCSTSHADGPFRYCPCGWMEAHFKGGTWHLREDCDR